VLVTAVGLVAIPALASASALPLIRSANELYEGRPDDPPHDYVYRPNGQAMVQESQNVVQAVFRLEIRMLLRTLLGPVWGSK